MSAVVVLIIGLAGLAWAAWLLIREPDARVRISTVIGAAGAFLCALLVALAAGTSGLAAVATGTIGAAVLALMVVGQWRFIRSIYARGGRKL
jgi:hypothetical protein